MDVNFAQMMKRKRDLETRLEHTSPTTTYVGSVDGDDAGFIDNPFNPPSNGSGCECPEVDIDEIVDKVKDEIDVGVTSLNALKNDILLIGGKGIEVVIEGNKIILNATGSGGGEECPEDGKSAGWNFKDIHQEVTQYTEFGRYTFGWNFRDMNGEIASRGDKFAIGWNEKEFERNTDTISDPKGGK